jgi:UDP-perosamine 4-acetyltransferase
MSPTWTIIGTGAHARKAAQCVLRAGDRVVAFVDENPAAMSPLPGVPVAAAAAWAAQAGEDGALFVAIGGADVRRRLMDDAAARGWRLPPLLHPMASVAPDALLGDGVLVAAGAVVESGAHVGRGAIVDIGVLVDHDVRVADFCHLRPGQVCPAGSVWPA